MEPVGWVASNSEIAIWSDDSSEDSVEGYTSNKVNISAALSETSDDSSDSEDNIPVGYLKVKKIYKIILEEEELLI